MRKSAPGRAELFIVSLLFCLQLYTVLWYKIVANTILWSIFRLSSNTVQSQISPWFLHLEVVFETSEFSICTLFHRRYDHTNGFKAFLKYIFYAFQDEEILWWLAIFPLEQKILKYLVKSLSKLKLYSETVSDYSEVPNKHGALITM